MGVDPVGESERERTPRRRRHGHLARAILSPSCSSATRRPIAGALLLSLSLSHTLVSLIPLPSPQDRPSLAPSPSLSCSFSVALSLFLRRSLALSRW
eukprot:4179469-Pleurochrysis_carterae.AAC.1